MKLPLYWVDAFTNQVFAGNPAAVVLLDRWPADNLLQNIAFENGLAETAFVVRTAKARFEIRWFTPAVEVDFCGHATLASAHALFNELGQPGEKIIFDSRSGPLTVAKRADLLELDFPATPPVSEVDLTVTRHVAAALGCKPVWCGRSKFDLFAVLLDAKDVRTLRPDLAAVSAAGGRGLIVTATGDEGCDFVSRFFAPQSGIPEDPVTGSAHSALTPYWANRLSKPTLHARQVSTRGGELWCTLAGDRVLIAGRAVLYLRGEISV